MLLLSLISVFVPPQAEHFKGAKIGPLSAVFHLTPPWVTLWPCLFRISSSLSLSPGVFASDSLLLHVSFDACSWLPVPRSPSVFFHPCLCVSLCLRFPVSMCLLAHSPLFCCFPLVQSVAKSLLVAVSAPLYRPSWSPPVLFLSPLAVHVSGHLPTFMSTRMSLSPLSPIAPAECLVSLPFVN